MLRHIRLKLGRFSNSKKLAPVIFIGMITLAFVTFLSLGNTNLAILILICTLVGERVVYGDDSQLSLSTLRTSQKSVSISDYRKKRFLALSFIEVRTSPDEIIGDSSPDQTRNRMQRATAILAQHVGSFSVELDSKTRSTRYVTTGSAKTAAEARQKAEAAAERVLRTIRELYGQNTRGEMIEGERIRDIFQGIIGGDFEVLSKKSGIVLRLGERVRGSMGFLLLKTTDRSIGIINIGEITSLIRNLGINVTYVVNAHANRAYDENALIDGIDHSQMWLVSSFFVVNGSDAGLIMEKAKTLKSSIESLTRGGVLRIEHGSATLNKLGGILLRSLEDRKLLLSNEQLINHIFTGHSLNETS
jgi:hypothetical protein